MIKGFKWKQQDAVFVMERSEHMVRSCQTSQGSQVSQKFEIIFFTQAVEVRGRGVWRFSAFPFLEIPGNGCVFTCGLTRAVPSTRTTRHRARRVTPPSKI